MIVQAIYDYSNREEPSYLSFQRGDIIQIIPQQSDTSTTTNGWSYGRIIEQQQQQQQSSSLLYNNINDSMGWFPTNYTTPIQVPSPPTTTITSSATAVISTTPMTVAQQQSQQQQLSLWNNGNNHNKDNEEDEDDGFNGTPMGGYIEPEEDEDDITRNRHDHNEIRDSPLSSGGVQSIPVPERRQRRIVTIPKNILSNISTTTVKVTHKILPITTTNKNKRNTTTTTSPAVYISP